MKFRTVKACRYGVRGDLTLPKIAGGSGSVVAFDFKVARLYRYRGLRELSLAPSVGTGDSTSKAQCSSGTKWAMEETARSTSDVTSPGTPKG